MGERIRHLSWEASRADVGGVGSTQWGGRGAGGNSHGINNDVRHRSPGAVWMRGQDTGVIGMKTGEGVSAVQGFSTPL